MKPKLPAQLEAVRIRTGAYASNESYGCTGAFIVQGPCGRKLTILSSGPDRSTSWEHVSVSTEKHIPNWQEMCFVKELFWQDEECVMQLHPPKSDYVNCHPRTLHLWKPINSAIPMPPSILIGPKNE